MSIASLPKDWVPNPLDPSLYHISEQEAKFLKDCTGITDDEELKNHILEVQAAAYTVFPYTCIRRFAFINSPLPQNSDYPAVLNLGKTRVNAILLDLACGFGNDARRAISDGFPLQNVICSDLQKGFFDLGHKLFKTTSETFPLAFFEGDVFETKFADDDGPTDMTTPNLFALTNLGQLKHKVSVINASAFFHLFDDERHSKLAEILSNLLSPQPGSIILGRQAGALSSKKRIKVLENVFMTVHCPESWHELWVGNDGPFRPDDMEIHASAQSMSLEDLMGATNSTSGDFYWLTWSVRRR